MKKVNFKNSVIALAIGLVTVSCGGGNTNKQNGTATETKPETKTEQAASNNETRDWQGIIKKNWGADIVMPNGWTTEKVNLDEANGKVYHVEVELNVGGTASAMDFLNTVFEATKAVAANGNHEVGVNAQTYSSIEGVTYDTADDALLMAGKASAQWCYTYNKTLMIVNYSGGETKVFLKF
jgi:hypothetical protein